MKTNYFKEIIKLLDLKPLEFEGGYYRETYRSKDAIPGKELPPGYRSDRCLGTAIYYLLTPNSFSALHNVNSDEVFHFYLGDPVQMLLLYPDGKGREVTLGQDIKRGQQLQIVVPRGVWQGAKLRNGGIFALLGTTVFPGFEYQDFMLGRRGILTEGYPRYSSLIVELTRDNLRDSNKQ